MSEPVVVPSALIPSSLLKYKIQPLDYSLIAFRPEFIQFDFVRRRCLSVTGLPSNHFGLVQRQNNHVQPIRRVRRFTSAAVKGFSQWSRIRAPKNRRTQCSDQVTELLDRCASPVAIQKGNNLSTGEEGRSTLSSRDDAERSLAYGPRVCCLTILGAVAPDAVIQPTPSRSKLSCCLVTSRFEPPGDTSAARLESGPLSMTIRESSRWPEVASDGVPATRPAELNL